MKPYLQAGLEAIKKAREESDPIPAAICAIKSGQKLTFNPAQDNFTISGGILLKPKMEDGFVPEEHKPQFHKSPPQFNQEGNCALADSLLEQQLDDLQDDKSCLSLQVGDTDGKLRSITDGQIRSTNQGTETKAVMLYKDECHKCHLQFANNNSLGYHRRRTGGNCLEEVCRYNHPHNYLVRKFDTEDHVRDFIGNNPRKC